MSANPIESLIADHRIIELVLAAMGRLADALEAGQPVDAEKLAGLVPFMRRFADAYHHGKEEERLFPLAIEYGLPPAGGPVQVMCAEHDVGRRLVGELDAAVARFLESGENAALPAALRAIPGFYVQHIWKEDNILFPMAIRALGAEGAARVDAAFVEVEAGAAGQDRARFVAFAGSLA